MDFEGYCLRFNFILIYFFTFFSICIGLVALLLVVNGLVGLFRSVFSLFVLKFDRNELVNQYECGFIPFSDARVEFNVPFYLVSLLFVLFDVEVALLIPLPFILSVFNFFHFYVFLFFFLLLTLGFAVEWFSNLLNLEVRRYRLIAISPLTKKGI